MNDTLAAGGVAKRLLFLVIDDDELSRELLTLLLEVEGYEVEVATSGEDALSKLASSAFKERAPDVILSDLQMTGISGSELAAALRSSVPTGTLLLAMSGSQPEEAVISGFDGFSLKPFAVKDLRELMSGSRPSGVEANALAGAGVPYDATSALPPLDEDIYEKLAEVMPELQLGQMYALCIADARTRIEHMKELVETGDEGEYCREAHAVKGGSGMIGATEIFLLAGAAEVAGLGGAEVLPNGGKAHFGAGTIGVTALVERLSLACERLERILVQRTR